MITPITIGNRIEEARRKNNLSQTQLAQKLCVTSQAVGKWERGQSMPDMIMFSRMAELLGVDLNYFSGSFPDAETSGKQPADVPAYDSPEEKPSWNMSGANWVNADFSGLKNLGDKFSGANISGCLFIGSDMSGLKLNGNHITKNDFSKTDFGKSKCKGAHISNNIFSECLFGDTLFAGCHIKNNDFSGAALTGTVFKACHVEKNKAIGTVWKRTAFNGTHINGMVFEGTVEDCSFVNCGFTGVIFKNAVLTNTFFKCKTKKIRFIDCKADNLTYAFLKNGKSDLSGITLMT